MSSSVIYTIGTALNRARDNNVPVQVLVEGQWLTGSVMAVDGHGVVLTSDELEHCVVRIQSVSAVRVFSPAPHRAPISAGAHLMNGGEPMAGAHPMPGPRPSYD